MTGPALADSLTLVLPALDVALASAESVRRITLLAGTLAPIHRAGFECRLETDDPQVDFQQGIRCREEEPEALAEFIAARLSGLDSRQARSWRALAALCRAASAPGSPLAKSLSELWLEFDVPPVAEDGSAELELDHISPSVFARVRPGPEAPNHAAVVFGLLTEGREMPALEHHLSRCIIACSDGAYVSHVALMLGREPAALRVNVSGLPLRLLPRYLEEIGWPGPADEIRRLAGTLLQFVDTIVIALDMGDQVEPRIGLECFFSEWHTVDPRWDYLLDHLVDAGLCSPGMRNALLAWPGRVSPADAPGPWPEQLLIDGLLQPAHLFGVLDRRLSHVKLVHAPGAPLRAKGYFGFEPIRLTPGGRPLREAEDAADAPPPASGDLGHPSPNGSSTKASITQAIQRATEYLLGKRNQAGMWRDFYARGRPGVSSRFMAGTSDEWVTAYVGWALATGTARESLDAAREAWDLLSARRGVRDGWGYNAQCPADADSTAWTLRLAQSLGVAETDRIRNARAFLLRHRAGGGIACYRPEDSRILARAVQMPGPFDGWCAPHVSITAAAATLGLGHELAEFLITQQLGDGSWTDYWWDDDEVTTARAVEALLLDGGDVSREAALRGVRWAVARTPSGSGPTPPEHSSVTPFATALCVETLARGFSHEPNPGVLRQGVMRLLGLQRANGSFEPSARLRAPAPGAMTIEASGEKTQRSPDHDAIYTTATALAALNTVYSLGSEVFAGE